MTIEGANKKIVKINSNEFKNSSRDKRELDVYRELGATILVVAKGGQQFHKKIDHVDGFEVLRLGTRPTRFFPNSINRILSVLIWAKIIKDLNADVLSGRDLEGVLIAYVSYLFSRKGHKPKIVYDSHEFEMGRNRVLNSKFRTFIVKKLERVLISKSSLAIFVSDSIKQKVIESYHTTTPAIVVRNIPPKWEIPVTEVEKRKKQFNDYFKKEYFIIMYHGALLPYRGIEKMLESASHFEDVACVLLGMVGDQYFESLKGKIASLGLEKRVYYHPAVPIEELGSYIAATNVGFATIEPRTLSYYYSLPNKMFENIQSSTPIIASNFPDMSSLVDQYNIGITVNPLSIDETVSAIKKMKEDTDYYSGLKYCLIRAKEELCWENEKKIIEEAYIKYL